MKKALSLLLALALCLTPALAQEARSQSGEVVAQALAQMGYTEGPRESTLFGQRFGYPHGYWCDMFVSWCAREAGVSEAVFPSSISCGEHYKMFKEMGRWEPSAVRGGTYQPRQGDLVLFRSVVSGAIHHVGLVLYAEDGNLFTIEGNALTNRLDYPPETVAPLRRNSLEPPDYVTVNTYPLEDPRLYGYAVPAYETREPLALEGFVDLGASAALRPQLEALAEAGIMPGTSSHTFSPRNGMPRGAFVSALTALCGLTGWEEDTPAFAGVPPESPCYEAVMTARSAGLLDGDPENPFAPEAYISGPDAQAIISRLLSRAGLEDRAFTFEEGDQSYILTPYATRASLAQALYALMTETPLWQGGNLETAAFEGGLFLRDEALDWQARVCGQACYVPLTGLLARFPELTAPGLPPALTASAEAPQPSENREPEAEPPSAAQDPEVEPPSKPQDPETEQPSGPPPETPPARARTVILDMEGRRTTVDAFLYEDVLYVSLEPAAKFLGVKLQARPAGNAS